MPAPGALCIQVSLSSVPPPPPPAAAAACCRGETLLRLRSQLHERLLDQLPPLHHLASALDQLALGAGAGGAGAAAASSSLLVLEQVGVGGQGLLLGEGLCWQAACTTGPTADGMGPALNNQPPVGCAGKAL
jgi:hypothetical protein